MIVSADGVGTGVCLLPTAGLDTVLLSGKSSASIVNTMWVPSCHVPLRAPECGGSRQVEHGKVEACHEVDGAYWTKEGSESSTVTFLWAVMR